MRRLHAVRVARAPKKDASEARHDGEHEQEDHPAAEAGLDEDPNVDDHEGGREHHERLQQLEHRAMNGTEPERDRQSRSVICVAAAEHKEGDLHLRRTRSCLREAPPGRCGGADQVRDMGAL